MNKIDTCGMSCPQPLLMTKNAINSTPNGVDIIVDNNTAKENVIKFLKNSGYSTLIKEDDDTFVIEARK